MRYRSQFDSQLVHVMEFLESPTTHYTRLRSLVDKGIPPKFRGKLWALLVGVDVRLRTHRGLYEQLLEENEGKNTSTTEQIEKDISRTFPGLRSDKQYYTSLRRILVAYAFKNPVIGYTQSMNFLAGILKIFMDEEKAFWMLSYIVEELLPFTFHDRLVGAFIDLAVLKNLTVIELPALAAHLDTLCIDYGMFATQWFMCLFVISLPSETAFRVWDRIFYDGPAVIFRTALQLLKLMEKRLLAVHESFELLCTISDFCLAQYDVDKIFNVRLARVGDVDNQAIRLLRFYERQAQD